MKYERIAVLRGGPSTEHEVSMKTGREVIDSLLTQDYNVSDIIISKTGEWLINGFVRDPDQVLKAIDVAFIALHGTYGEDGEVQKILQRNKVRYNGSPAFSSAIAFNKLQTKRRLKQHNILSAKHFEIDVDLFTRVDKKRLQDKVLCYLGREVIIKPVNGGSSVDTEFIDVTDALIPTLEKLLKKYDQLVIEEFIRGKEVTCAILENFRDQRLYTFPLIEIRVQDRNNFFDHQSKYDGNTIECCPGNFNFGEKEKIVSASQIIHEVIGLEQYSRSDFILKGNDLYFLEVNTLPGLTKNSLYPKAASAVGLSFNDLISHLVSTAKC